MSVENQNVVHMQKEGTQTPKREGSARDLLLEFFHEIICRIIPGMVVLAFYASTNILELFRKNEHLAVLLSILFFVVAWLIGVIVELTPFLPVALLLKLLSLSKWGWVKWLHNRLLADVDISKFAEADRRSYLKTCAEKVMFRGLAAICFFTYFYPPLFWPTLWKPAFGLSGAIFFLFAWVWARVCKHPAMTNSVDDRTMVT